MFRRCSQIILAIVLIIIFTGCSLAAPPLELSPQGDIVKKAIALQLKMTETNISEQLNATNPDLEIKNIKVEKIEPVFIAKLAAYHLQGTYNSNIKLPRQKVSQQNNQFDVYIQRQSEGKTWRLLKTESRNDKNKPIQWSSYLIK
jgi:PBP1b-binding outer membrane lipoprotein LpoB